MAALSAYQFFNTFDDLFPIPTYVDIDHDRVTLDYGGYTTTVTGDFSGWSLWNMWGTVTGISVDYDGFAVADVTGLSVDANSLFDSIHYGREDDFFDAVLPQVTLMIGSQEDDFLATRAPFVDAYGEGGDDVVAGWSGHDSLFGGAGKDKLLGYGGRDHLAGGSERDVLKGGGGKDRLEGDAGDDKLIGGRGNDLLTGGSGSDTFVFNRTSGDDDITDFDLRNDTLVFRTGQEIEGSQLGRDALLEWGNNSLLIYDTDVDDLLF